MTMSTAATVEDGHDTMELPEDYAPTEFDAIVGWARQHYHHSELTSSRDTLSSLIACSADH